MHRRPYISHNEVPKHCTVFKSPRVPFDPHTKVLGCVTTSGGDDNWHPSGERRFTIRELAALMSFPPDFQFPSLLDRNSAHGSCLGEVIKQIGNSIPPAVWTVFIHAIIDALKAFDNGLINADGYEISSSVGDARASKQKEIICLDLDDEAEASQQDARKLSRTLRKMSVSVSRASSRTLSPEPASDSNPTKRTKISPTKRVDIIDLTDS